MLAALVLPSATATADPSMPTLTQVLPEVQQDGCRRASGQTADQLSWALLALRPDKAWPLSRGAGATVAVVGSGVDDTSGALGSRLSLGPREYGSGSAGRDCVGHGTFLAGLIAARQRAAAGFSGIAPDAAVIAVAVTDDAGTTNADTLAKGIRAASEAGAEIVLAGVPVPTASQSLVDAVRYAIGRGALVVAPTGPDGTGQGMTVYPAALPGVLAVSDIAATGVPSLSTPGGRVDLVAPGVGVVGTGPGGVGYFTASGPSFAAAYVAGAAALVLGYRPELSGEQLRRRLLATAYRPGTALPDPFLGYGTVDPVAAVSATVPGENGDALQVPAPAERLLLPRAADDAPARRATAVVGCSAVVVLVVVIAAVSLPRARRRQWRPAAGPGPAPAPGIRS
ncbi:S8 family serine peptidase [Kitasatospora sp. NE20-6]|uniref:S8 family serine peptidase n=1 Tax=Kitasatospora sp. NE20-6 TaxID=2859066 RepID=UPI0038B35830